MSGLIHVHVHCTCTCIYMYMNTELLFVMYNVHVKSGGISYMYSDSIVRVYINTTDSNYGTRTCIRMLLSLVLELGT